MYHAFREPPREWLEACRRVAPPADQLSHLTIRWVPGEPEAPIQRWAIFECVPRHVLEDVDHPVLGQLDPTSTDPMVAWAVQYTEQTGCVPTPLWCVQGAGGGHPFAWTREEQVLAKAGVLQPRVLPLLGDLPYAEPDARVWEALQQRSILRRTIADAYEARVVAREMAERKARAIDMADDAPYLEAAEMAMPHFMNEARVIDRDERRDVGGLVTHEDIARYVETGDLTITR